ncbi:rhomboid family intramembrane serine protease [Candidatus Woesearchaeota archaeon]|nr:MAG: rhomboid family intramembrane serine protease [Candidatus Woesearchaeota archaeon]
MKKEIESEAKFTLKQVLFILLLPLTLIKVLLGKEKLGVLLEPVRDLARFLLAAKTTATLIIINILVFIAEVFFISEKQLLQYAFRPEQLAQLNFAPMASSWFLHASLLHLAGNMLFLFVFGRIVEKRLGPFLMLIIYFGSAIISSFFAALFGQGGIGASGAIAGLISTAILIDPFYFTFIFGIPIPVIILGWSAIILDITGVLLPTNDNIGHFAHLGGYLAVSILVFLLGKENKEKVRKGFLINTVFAIALLTAYLTH